MYLSCKNQLATYPALHQVFNMVHSAQTGKLENVMINKQSRNHTLCMAMKSPGTHLQTRFPHTGMLAQSIRFVDCKLRFLIRLQCCYWIACHAIILQVFGMSSGAMSWLIPLISLANHTLYSPLQPSNRWVINSIYWPEVTYTPAFRAIRIYSALIDCSLFRLPC